MMDEKEEACEWIVAFKHNLRKAIFEDYKVTIDDTETVEHYYRSQANLDRELCKKWGGIMNNIDWDDLQRQYDESNPDCPWIDDDGYRGTGITKEEWEEAKHDNEED